MNDYARRNDFLKDQRTTDRRSWCERCEEFFCSFVCGAAATYFAQAAIVWVLR